MKITVSTYIFKDAMDKIFKVIGKSTAPILENVLVRSEGGYIYLSATNLEQYVQIRISADTTADMGFVFSDTKSLLKAMKFFADDFITLEYVERENKSDSKIIKFGELTISCGGKKAKQVVIYADEFPSFPELEGELTNDTLYSNAKLKERFNAIKYAVSTDSNRPALCGICFRETDMAANDGHRFSLNTDDGFLVAESFIVPCKAISLVNDILGESLSIKTTKKHIQFNDDENNITIISRLCEGTYADYPRYIKHRGCREVTASVKDYANNLKYLRTFAPEKKKFKVSWYEDKLGFKPAGGYYESEIAVEGEMDIELQFNGNYMLEALAQFEGTVIINSGNSFSQIILTSETDRSNTAIVSTLRNGDKLFQKA